MGDNTRNHQSQQENTQAILVDSIFDAGNYLSTHKIWIKALGYRQAVLLAYMIDQRAFHRMKGELQADGSFYKTRETLASLLGTGVRDIDSGLAELHRLGFITSVRKGQPAKLFYKINDAKILEMTGNPDLLKSISSSAPKADLSSAPKADLELLEKQINYPKENYTREENDPKTYTPPVATRARVRSSSGCSDFCSDGTKVWNCYVKSYVHAYGIEPDRSAKANAIIKRAIEAVGTEKACLAIAWFPQRKEKSWVKACHPLEFFAKNLQQLVVEVTTQRLATWSNAEEAQRTQEFLHHMHLRETGVISNPLIDGFRDTTEPALLGDKDEPLF